jgi:hypothetical protein
MPRINRILAACRLEGHDGAVLGGATALAEKQEAELHLLHVLSKDGNETDAKVAARHAREQSEKLLPAEQVLKLTLAILARISHHIGKC